MEKKGRKCEISAQFLLFNGRSKEVLRKEGITPKGFRWETRPLEIGVAWQTSFGKDGKLWAKFLKVWDTGWSQMETHRLHVQWPWNYTVRKVLSDFSSQEKCLFDANVSSISQHLPLVTKAAQISYSGPSRPHI